MRELRNLCERLAVLCPNEIISLADLPTQFEPAKYERMVFGIILVLMMIFRPQGIFPARRRQRELAH